MRSDTIREERWRVQVFAADGRVMLETQGPDETIVRREFASLTLPLGGRALLQHRAASSSHFRPVEER